MKLTPLEIRKQEFRRTMRGFDTVEVQTFLEMVAEQYESVMEENNAMNRRIIELETKLQDYRENEQILRETLVNFQEVKKQSEESSKKQAGLVVREAELKAVEILEGASKHARLIREEIKWLKSQKESFINRLRHILVSQVELLSVMEMDDVLPDSMKKALKSPAPAKTAPPASAPENVTLSKEEDALARSEKAEDADKSADEDVNHERIIIKRRGRGTNKPVDNDDNSSAIQSLSEMSTEDGEDINEFFKKGIEIDDLIKSVNKKR